MGCTQDIEGLAKVSMVEVPVSWVGIAEEVKMMGSFDNWSRGIDLSPEDYTFSGEQTVRDTCAYRMQDSSPEFAEPTTHCAPEWVQLTQCRVALCGRSSDAVQIGWHCITLQRLTPSSPWCSSRRRWSCCLGNTNASSWWTASGGSATAGA